MSLPLALAAHRTRHVPAWGSPAHGLMIYTRRAAQPEGVFETRDDPWPW